MINQDLVIKLLSIKLKNQEQRILELKNKYSVIEDITWLIRKESMTFDFSLNVTPKNLPHEILQIYLSAFKEAIYESEK